MSRLTPRIALACACALAFAFHSPHAPADEPRPPATPCNARAALEKLKSLAGDWTATVQGEHAPDHSSPPARFNYRVTGNGSAVIETMFAGSDHEMVSVYFVDGSDLRMTHYCAIGNQPHMKLTRAASTPQDLHLEFDGGTNLDPARDPHVHDGRIEIKNDKHVIQHWRGFQDGKPNQENRIILTR